MYDRAALMEATMVSLVVTSWYCYARAGDSPRWGLAAGAAAIAAYFTKASAVFFLPAIAGDAVLTIALARGWPPGREDASRPDRARGAWHTLAGLTVAGMLSLGAFVLPNWNDYRFYNWQMSVVRKPSYSVKAFLDRLTWLPVVHDFFTRMWVVLAFAAGGAPGLLLRWRRAEPAERVLLWWTLLGMTELVLHDVGNERRLVFLIPALVGLASIAIARNRRLLDDGVASASMSRVLWAAPAVVGVFYLLTGPLIRVPFLDQLRANVFRAPVRWSVAVSVALGLATCLTWPRVPRLLGRARWGPVAAAAIVLAVMAMDLRQYGQWASMRTTKNYDAMVAIGRWLPPGTLVHGKLANGLALESRITPVFVGRGFGNYEDRAARTDVRYLLTYVKPSFGYESQARNPVTLEILAACPGWRVVREFDVAETWGGRDRAALIDKYPDRPGRTAPVSGGLQ
jgi:hypothetical protein